MVENLEVQRTEISRKLGSMELTDLFTFFCFDTKESNKEKFKTS